MDKITTIFRIEKDGVGPWWHEDSYRADSNVGTMVNRMAMNASTHPTPHNEGSLKEFMHQHGNSLPYCYHCAVISLDQLFHWFGEYEYEMRVLSKEGFKVAMIEVPENAIVRGDFQVLFDCTEVIEKVELEINEVFEHYWNSQEEKRKMAA